MLRNLKDNGRVALVAAAMPSHETYQFKGAYVSSRKSEDKDLAIQEIYRDKLISHFTQISAWWGEYFRTIAYTPSVAVTFENQKIIDELNKQLARKTRQVQIIQKISTEINSSLDLERILKVILHLMDRVFGFRHSLILLLDASGEKLQVAASHGYEDSGIGAEVFVGQRTFEVVAKRKKSCGWGILERKGLIYPL